MSAWQEYKKKLGETKPWDMVNPNVERVSEEIANQRLETCLNCSELIRITKQCKQCGCFMQAKVKLKNSSCPLKKW